MGVLPRLDLPRAILATNGLSLIPSMINLLTSQTLKYGPFSKWTMFSLNILALLMQLSLLFIALFGGYSPVAQWQMPVALLLVSVSASAHFCKSLPVLRKLCVDMNASRHKLGLFTSIYKVGITLLAARLYHPDLGFSSDIFATLLWTNCWPLVIQVGSSVALYLSCTLAFKLGMRRVCFTLPITCVTPVSLLVSALLCRNLFECGRTCVWHVVVGICLWWLSHVWTTSSMWSKMRTIKRPFTFKFQFFNACFPENSLMLQAHSDSERQV